MYGLILLVIGYFLLSGFIAAIVLLVGEYIRRRFKMSNEVSRKLVHAVHGLCIAVWPFFLGNWIVYAVEALFLLSISEVYKLRWFRWMWRVGRKSWGEYMYPIGVIAAVTLAQSKWIFLAAMLQLALADAVAALVGKSFGRKTTYKVFSQNKSVHGSLAFFVTSALILWAVIALSPLELALAGVGMIIAIATILTVVENLGVYGLDNLGLPVVTVILLNLLV